MRLGFDQCWMLIFCISNPFCFYLSSKNYHLITRFLSNMSLFSFFHCACLFWVQTLLAFVNYHLYHSINVKYPPILDPRLEALASGMLFTVQSKQISMFSLRDFSSLKLCIQLVFL